MTPNEKAIELVHKFKCYTGKYYNSKRNIITSKQCALIAVDEILIEIAYTQNYVEDTMNKIQVYISYWQEVKQEIEKI